MAAQAGASGGPGLRHLRYEAGLTQQSLANRAGVSVAVIRDLEQGRTRRLRAGTGQRLAAALNVPAEQFVATGNGGRPAPELAIAVLGPLAVYRRGVPVPLGGPRQLALLGLLAVQPGIPVHRDVIADVLWRGGSSPPGDNAMIQSCVSRLRGLADPGTTTLYLGDEELSLNAGSGTVTGTRYYTLGGVTVTRTGASSVAYLVGDQQGTDSLAIVAATLATTRRYYDPYGNPRGQVPSSFPAGEKGFVGGIDDTATGLTNLGAREYQPATSSFISPDPLLKPYDPQGLNAYTYAADNPTTDSDPTGALSVTASGCTGSVQHCQQVTTYTGAYGCTGPTQAAVDQSTEQADQEAAQAAIHDHHADPRKPKNDPILKDLCAKLALLCRPLSPVLDDGSQPGQGNNLQWGVPAGCGFGGVMLTCAFASSGGSGKSGGGGSGAAPPEMTT